ncbi:hypothetical protein TNCV_4687471 [Trichonephila clavipes]|nr:hypothetical protein TNCV_4687471 [Trichonephila clavipes]
MSMLDTRVRVIFLLVCNDDTSALTADHHPPVVLGLTLQLGFFPLIMSKISAVRGRLDPQSIANPNSATALEIIIGLQFSPKTVLYLHLLCLLNSNFLLL